MDNINEKVKINFNLAFLFMYTKKVNKNNSKKEMLLALLHAKKFTIMNVMAKNKDKDLIQIFFDKKAIERVYANSDMGTDINIPK